ncbi:peptidoglycan-binding protein [Streptomyces sp. NPDC048002]|uniref:peptidoglycan-binding domain-containing protein n=1 Tax=Streptomyces sp. NPDC048002 TaxID=3154344 RepID=UPI003408816C
MPGRLAWVAAAVGVLALLTAALVHLFTRPVAPVESPALLPPAASAPVPSSPPAGAEPRLPQNPSPSGPGSQPGSPSPEVSGNAGLAPEGSTGDVAAVLARGDRGSEVLDLQRRLRTAGVDTAPLDGVYGQPTEAAVQNYQALRGIRTDPAGVYGPATRAALERET